MAAQICFGVQAIDREACNRHREKRMKMKINSKDFRVRAGNRVNLEKWPTKVDPVYK